ncbi:MAG: TlpA family protein disulfide reductase [Bacteroidota bacterium]|nr:TlpA family protein disulfide reductase [Bacteroidota bacterium]
MKTFLIITVLFFCSVTVNVAQNIRKITKAELTSILKNPSDKLHVINFWATWCGPCIAELPAFQKTINESDRSKVDFLFVSLDFPSDADKKLMPFLKKNNYTFNVALMVETDHNSWIDEVDSGWQGSIPATLFFNHARKIHHFIAEPLDKPQLEKTIHSFL